MDKMRQCLHLALKQPSDKGVVVELADGIYETIVASI